MPRGKRYANDRAPTLDELRKLTQYPDRRIKPIVYTMVSSGIRLGAFDYLRWGDVTRITKHDKIVAAKIVVYAGEDEEYFSFITKEAYDSLHEWMDCRKQCGETVDKDTWLMRNLWDVTTPKGKGVVTIPKKLKSTGVKRLIERALWAQRLRMKLAPGKRRHEFQSDHGMRKTFKGRCELGGMKSINVETLMGHSIGIQDSYYRPTEEELLQDYLKATDFLTVDQGYSLQDQVNQLTERTKDSEEIIESKLQQKDSEILGWKKRYYKDVKGMIEKINHLVGRVCNKRTSLIECLRHDFSKP